MADTPFTITVQGKGLEETAQGFKKLGDSVETAATKIEGVKLDPKTLDATAQAATTAAEAIADVGASAQTAAPRIEDTNRAIEKTRAAAQQAGAEMSEFERAMSGEGWGTGAKEVWQDAQGMEAYAKSIGAAGQQAAATGPSVGKLAEVFNQVGGRGAAANDILEASQNLLKGNERAGLSAAKGIGAFLSSFSMGAMGIFLSTLGLVTAGLISWITKSKEAKEVQEALAKSIAATAKELAEYNNTPQDKLQKAIAATNTALDEQLTKVRELFQLQNNAAKQQYETEKSNLEREKNTPGSKLTEAEYARRLNELDNAEMRRLSYSPVLQAKQEANVTESNAERAKREADLARQKNTEELAKVDIVGALGLQKTYEEYQKAVADRTAAILATTTAAKTGAPNPEALRAMDAAAAREEAARNQLAKFGVDPTKDAAEVAEKIKKTKDERAQQAADIANRQKLANDAAEEAAKKAAEARRKANYEEKNLELTQPGKERVQANENYARTPKPTAEDKAAYEAQIAKLNKQAEEAMLAGKFSGEGSQDEAVAAIAKAKADWAKKYGSGDTPANATPFSAYKPAVKTTTYAPDGTPDGKTSAGGDLATPLNDAAKAHEDATKQSGESTKAAAEAAEKLKDAAKPLDAAPLTTALQAAAAAQQAAGAQSVAALQTLTTTAGQLTQIAQQQSRQIESLRSQVAQVAQQVTNLRAAQNAA